MIRIQLQRLHCHHCLNLNPFFRLSSPHALGQNLWECWVMLFAQSERSKSGMHDPIAGKASSGTEILGLVKGNLPQLVLFSTSMNHWTKTLGKTERYHMAILGWALTTNYKVLAWWYPTSPILRGFKKNAEELAGASTLSCYLPSSLLQERRFTCKLRGLGDTDQHTPD